MFMTALFQIASAIATPPPPSRMELPNGVRVWIAEDHSRPVALVQVTYRAGSLNEEPGKTGVAHYVEHMVYRATRNIRNEDIYGYIDRIGGRYTGGTWPEYTRYAETVPSWAVESALRVTAERMCCALFDSTEFERERSNVVTEANGFSDLDPVNALRDAMMYAAFEVHPYRLNSNTWARDNLVLTRDEAFAWYKSYYGPNNAVLVIAGDVDTAEIRRLVAAHFAGLPRARLSGRIDVVEPPQRAEKTIRVTSPDSQPRLEVLYHAPQARHPDFPAFHVATRLLGERLRDVFGARASVRDSASQYPFVLRIAVTGDSLDHASSLRRIDGAIRALRDSTTATELAAQNRSVDADSSRARVATATGLPPRRSDLTRVADELSDREASPWDVDAATRARIAHAIAAVSTEDVRRVVDRWLRSSQRTVGMLVRGTDDVVAEWTDRRALAGERMEIPPLRTLPAKRVTPDPVPRRALEPLAPISIPMARRTLSNGVVVRTAQGKGDRYAILLRSDSGAASDSGGHNAILRRASAASVDSVIGAVVAAARSQRLPSPIAVALVGPESPQRLLDRIASEGARLPRIPPLDAAGARAARDTSFSVPGATQISIAARLPGVPRDHPDRRALELLNYIVGVPSYGGRLGWALTKSGLTYAAAARTHFGARGGYIALTTTADTRNAEAAVQAIREVVAGIGDRGVDVWEVDEAKAFVLGRTLLYGARDGSPPEAIAAALLDSEEAGVELLDLPALSRAYLRITPEEVNRVARTYYRPERLTVVMSGALPASSEHIFAPGTFRMIFEP